MDVNERSDKKSDIQSHWMAAHARLKNEFTVDEKCHNLIGSTVSCCTLFGNLQSDLNIWNDYSKWTPVLGGGLVLVLLSEPHHAKTCLQRFSTR